MYSHVLPSNSIKTIAKTAAPLHKHKHPSSISKQEQSTLRSSSNIDKSKMEEKYAKDMGYNNHLMGGGKTSGNSSAFLAKVA